MKEQQLYAILLMAGNSVRFGKNKLTHFVNNKKMYQYALELVLSCSELFSDIIVVTQYDEIETTAVQNHIKVVRNFQSEKGITSSIHLGIGAIPPAKGQAYLFLVGDQPWLTETTIRGLVDGWKQSKKGIGCVTFQEKLGNPVIFSWNYREELLALSGDRGGKQVLCCHKEDVYYYEVTKRKELEDIDYKER